MLNRLEGIVLRTVDYGESNRIVTVLSAEYGKVALMARGVRKPKSRLAHLCQPFTHASFYAYMSTGGMGTLQQGEVLDSLRALREQLTLCAYASYMAEMFDRLVEERLPSEGLYRLLLWLFRGLRDGQDAEILARLAEVKLAEHAGFGLAVGQCAACGKAVESSPRFSVHLGGPLCDSCEHSDVHAYPMLPATWRVLQSITRMRVEQLGAVRLGSPVRRQLATILGDYIAAYGGVHLKTRAFLDQLARLEEGNV